MLQLVDKSNKGKFSEFSNTWNVFGGQQKDGWWSHFLTKMRN
jgi:hypothetical protein